MSYVIFCLFELIVGILLLINPVGFTSWIIICAGAALSLFGLFSVIKYFREPVEEAARGQLLMKGLVLLLAGIFCMVRSNWFIATFPLLTMLYGVSVLVAGLGKVQNTVDMLRRKNRKWFLAALSAAISVLCAAVILANPFGTTAVLWSFTGISLIVEAVFDVIAWIATGSKSKSLKG